MSYVGNQPLSVAFLTDTFTGDGTTTAFTMTVAPANTSSIIVAVTGVLQTPSTYSVSGTTLTFSAAPPSGTSNISVRYLGIPASGVTTTAYRTVTEFTATAGQTSFSVASYTVGFIDVYRNGVRLNSADYTATTGTTVVLTSGATLGDTVTTMSFFITSVINSVAQTNGSSTSQTLITPILTTPTMSTATLTGTSTFAGGVANAYGFGVGTAIPSSGAGISFPATQSASTDANTLDDYEEGTWTPKDAVGAALTLTTPAYYRKVGSLVTITFDLTWTSNTTPTLTGLPWTNSSTHAGGCFCYNGTTAVASLLISAGSTTCDLYNGITSSPNPASKRFIGSFVYQTST